MGEQHHDQFVRDANRLVAQMFVEHARGVEAGANARTTASRETPRM
jgi:hypothetical protein